MTCQLLSACDNLSGLPQALTSLWPIIDAHPEPRLQLLCSHQTTRRMIMLAEVLHLIRPFTVQNKAMIM
jgi:hypothetical protein